MGRITRKGTGEYIPVHPAGTGKREGVREGKVLVVDLIIGMLILSGISMACLGLYGWRFAGRIPAAVPYTLLMFSAAAWAVLYALDLVTGSLQHKILFHNLRFLVLPFFSVLELWLVLAFVKKTEWLRKDRAAAVLVIPVAAAILAITSPFHTLFRYNFSINTSGPIPVLQYSESPFYTLYVLYSLILLILAIIILVVESRKRGSLTEERTILLLIALILPTVINYLFVFGITPIPWINMTAPLLWIPAILYTVAIFRYRLLDVVPVARDRLIETLNTPMLVLDMEGRIIDQNPAARSFFPVPDGVLQGRLIGEVVRDWPEFLAMCRSEEGGTIHLSRVKDGSLRAYIGSADLFHTTDGETEGRLVILRDVTEQKQTEDALRESERKYQNLYRYAEVGLFETSLVDATIVACNQMYSDLFGFTSPEEAVGQDVLGLYVNPADRDVISRQLRETGKLDNHVVQFRNKKTGTIFFGQFSARLNRERDVAEGSIVDITTQHESDEKIRHIASFPQLNPDLILEVDLSGTVLFANPGMNNALIRMGLSDPLIFIPSGCLDQLNRARPSGMVQWKKEITIDGRSFGETLYYAPEFDALRIYASDITERRDAELALRQSEERFRLLIQNASDLIRILDPDRRILFESPSSERILGYPQGSLIGKDPFLNIHPDDRERVAADLSEVYDRTNPGIPTEYRIQRADGTWIWVDSIGVNLLGVPGVNGVVVTTRPIQQRKEMEQELRESESWYREFFTTSRDSVFITSITGEWIDFNDTALEMFGYSSRAELMALPLADLYEKAEDREEIIARIGREGYIKEYPVRLRTKDGPVIDTLVTAVSLRETDGSMKALIGSIRDVTRQKMTERALQMSEGRLNAVVRGSPIPQFVIDLHHRIISWNRAMEELTGIRASDIVGTNQQWKAFYPVDRPVLADLLVDGMVDRIPRLYPGKVRASALVDGAYEATDFFPNMGRTGTWLFFTAAPIRDIEGSLIGAVETLEDITNRKEVEEELRETNAYLGNLLDYANAPIIVWDPEFRITRFNHAFERLTGCITDQVLGKQVDSLFPADTRKRSMAYLRQAMTGERWETVEIPILRRDGGVRIVLWNSATLYAADGTTVIAAIAQGQDITERKEAEAALRESNAYLGNLLDYANAPIIVWDPEFRITRFNHAFERLTGCITDQVLGKQVDSLFPADTRERSMAYLLQAMTGERWETVEIPILRRDGGIRIVLWNSATLYAADGTTVIAAIAQGQDITERKEAEAALRESNAYLGNLLDYANAPIIVWDPEFRITRFNHAFERLTGCITDQVLGKQVDSLFPADTRERSMAYLRQAMTGERWETVEIPILRRDGGVRIVLWNSATLYAADGTTVIAAIAQGQDITERKEAEDALRESEERFRLSFEQAGIGMTLSSPDGQLEKVNQAFCEMLGYTEEDLQAKGFAGITSPDDLADSRECVRSLLAGERTIWRTVKRYLHRDGRIIWADVSTMLLHDRNGDALLFVRHIVNITERKEAEFQRETLIRELEQKNAELERFTYTVSHDLKSPLITIRGFLGLLREDAMKGDTLQMDRDISRISSATDKMQALLSDLLTLSRIGMIAQPSEQVNFGTIAGEARELLAGPIRENGITVTIARDLPDVFVDHTRIREVLTNLIENAIKFRGDQPEPKVEIGVHYEEDRPVFYVRDNGIGIETQYLTRIFGLFEKLDPKTEGTGVGLAIVKRIIEVHGGTIWVESAGLGKGTTFWFTMPPASDRI
jgi:PAS domain S-box-containing protein